jgi:regulatory protein
MKILEDSKSIRLKIMDFLSRREHSSKEIFKKLSPRVESKELLEEEIEKLKADGLLSDERFAESYFQSRKNRGYGPLRIRNELKQRGVGDLIFYPLSDQIEWSELALEALKKKISGDMPTETKDILKLKKFLNYRGFDFQDIDKAFQIIKSE